MDWQLLGLRVLGLLLLVVAATALRALNDGGSSASSGGGRYSRRRHCVGFRSSLQSCGRQIGAGSLFLLGLTVFADISWLKVIDWLGYQALVGTQKLGQQALARVDQLRDRRARKNSLSNARFKLRSTLPERKSEPSEN